MTLKQTFLAPCLALLLTCTPLAFGKGMQNLAQTEGQADNVGSPQKDSEATNGVVKPAPDEIYPGENTPDASKALPQTATSRALANKLALRTGLGLGTISSEGNNWRGLGAAELAASFAMGTLAGFDWALSLRYAPIEVRPEIDEQSYVGVVEGYHFGAVFKRSGIAGGTAFASGELGVMAVHLHDTDPLPNDSKPGTGFNVTLGGGIDWPVLEKVMAGPVAYVGAGSFSTFQVGGTASFLF